MLPEPVSVRVGSFPAVHWLDDEVIVVAGAEESTVTAIDESARPRTVLALDRFIEASCATDTYLVLAFGIGPRSPMLAYDRDARLVFDFHRDLTGEMRGGRLILAGRSPDDVEWLAHLGGEQVFWRFGEDIDLGEILDLRTNAVTEVLIPTMFDLHPIALAPDRTLVTRVLPAEGWTVRADGPIERWAVPDMSRTTPCGGGRLLLWDEAGPAIVFNPATASADPVR